MFDHLSPNTNLMETDSNDELERFRSLLLLGLTLGLVLSVLLFWILTSYYRVDVPASLFAGGNDGWCKPPTESIGIHCFGDFNERVGLPAGHPQKGLIETSPIGPIITTIGNLLSDLTTPRIALMVFLILYTICAVTPIAVETRRRPRTEQVQLTLLLAVGTYPFIMVLDRGQSLALAIPLMYLYLRAVHHENFKLMTMSIVALSCIRPVFIGLSLMVLLLGRPRRFITTLTLSVSFPIALLVLTGSGRFTRVRDWFETSRIYVGSFREVNTPNNPNASIGAALYALVDFFAHLPSQIQFDQRLHAAQYAHKVAAILALLLLIGLFVVRQHVAPIMSGLLLLIVLSLAIGKYVAPYYLVFVLAFCPLLISQSTVWFIKLGLASKVTLFLALLATCSPAIIPILPPNWYELQSTGNLIHVRTLNTTIAVTLWTCFAILVVLGGVSKHRSNHRLAVVLET